MKKFCQSLDPLLYRGSIAVCSLSAAMNKAGAWQCWKMSWDLYKVASGLDQKDEKIQGTTLLHVLGWEFFQILCGIPRMVGKKLLP